MKFHQLTVEGAFAALHSGAEGLSAAEATRRGREYGPNVVETARGESLVLRFLKGFTHFFAIILWLAAGLAFLAEWREPGQGMTVLGLAIIGVILVNGLFSFWQEYRAEKALAALQRLLPREVQAVRDGRVTRIPATDLVPGDLLLVESGDLVPADCRLIEGSRVRVNNATITGESLPHSRQAGSSDEADYLHSNNVLLAGTSVVSGDARALVFATGPQTAFGRIARLTQAAREQLSPLQREIARLSHVVALFSLAVGVLFFLIGRALGLSFWANFIFAIGVIVANVPEGLLPTVTLALAMGSQRMARRNALIRHLPAVETLGAATVICTDKTGTLTRNSLEARRLFLPDAQQDEAIGPALPALAQSHPHFFEVARRCHTLRLIDRNGSRRLEGDPMEIALVRMAGTAADPEADSARIDEIPFDSQRKRLTTLHRTPAGPVLYVKGAPETVVPRCAIIQLAGRTEPLTAAFGRRIQEAQDTMADEGLRVLAFAHRALPQFGTLESAEQQLIFDGLIGLEDPPRPEVQDAIARCRQAGIKVIMITGDHPHTALAVARKIGLVRSPAPVLITGDSLKRLSDTELQLALDAPEIVFARVAADQKMRIVSALKRKQEIVAVTGDGVNDAPALKRADIGVAMGLGGTDVAREAADMILLDDNFASIVAAVEEGRAVYANIRKFLTYILTSNVPELVPYLAFVLFRIPLPLTIIQILAVDLGTDMVPALALGAELPGPQTMVQPPRQRQQTLLNGALIARSYLWLGLLQASAAMAAFLFVLKGGGWSYGEPLAPADPLYRRATTACLSAIIVMQVANVFLCRSRTRSAFRSGLRSNPLLLWGIGAETALILLIDYTPWGNAIFGTAPISLAVWFWTLPFALLMVGLEEFRKWIIRRLDRRRSGCA